MPFDLGTVPQYCQRYERQIKAHSTDDFMKVDMKWAGDIFFMRS